MQSISGYKPPFICFECKTQFNSASSLLKHFSQHIKFNYSTPNKHYAVPERDLHLPSNSKHSREAKENESILEKVLRQSLTDESNVQDSSSSNSEYCTSTSDNEIYSSSEQDSQIPQTVIEIGEKSRETCENSNDVILVKFDLQKRLENCILKLVSKRDSICDNTLKSSLITPNSLDVTITTPRNNVDADDFNPLTFCVVTMEEGEGKLELSVEKNEENEDSLLTKKITSNRKQQSPKKIHHQANLETGKMIRALQIGLGDKLSMLSPPLKKKYPCNICDKVFGWSTDLKRHVLTHTGERPFKCQQCPATFTRNFLLQKHETKVHSSLSLENVVHSNDVIEENDMIKEEAPKIEKVERSIKRKKKHQHTWKKKQVVNDLDQKLLKFHQYNPIPYGIFSHKALNIT